MVDQAPAASASFAAALAQLHAADLRDDLVTRELPAPTGLAPEAFALAGDIRPEPGALDSVYGTGRFVLLHDREEPDAWGGAWRIVCYAQAPPKYWRATTSKKSSRRGPSINTSTMFLAPPVSEKCGISILIL